MTLDQIATALARYQAASANLDDSRKTQDEMYAANDCTAAWEAVRLLLPIAQAAVKVADSEELTGEWDDAMNALELAVEVLK